MIISGKISNVKNGWTSVTSKEKRKVRIICLFWIVSSDLKWNKRKIRRTRHQINAEYFEFWNSWERVRRNKMRWWFPFNNLTTTLFFGLLLVLFFLTFYSHWRDGQEELPAPDNAALRQKIRQGKTTKNTVN